MPAERPNLFWHQSGSDLRGELIDAITLTLQRIPEHFAESTADGGNDVIVFDSHVARAANLVIKYGLRASIARREK